MQRLPLIVPNPPRLADYKTALERIEVSGIYSNFGPEARRFEQEAAARLFGGEGACLTVANATLGLMLALKDAVGEADGRYAVMPALTFAATAQAAWWAGLTPLVCDIDPDDWTACPAAEERLLHQHGDRIAALVPYAAFGHAIDLDRYAWLAKRHEVKVVIDAAASLGTSDAQGRSFGAGAPFPVVFSMHATKPFAVAEGGLIHCGDRDTIERLRAMANFGFAGARSASVPGLNAKLPEVLAAIANAKLETFGATCAARERVTAAYRAAIGGRYATQPAPAGRQALGFFQLLLPRGADRARVAAALEAEGIGTGQYFSPHIGQQPWVRQVATIEPTPVADDVAGRILSLPLHDAMTAADAERVIAALDRACAAPHVVSVSEPPRIAETLVVGGGPAGTALLTAASKQGLLAALAPGLVLIERDRAIGGGQLGRYAITSDSTAQTFLSAVVDNPYPEIAALAGHPAARTVDSYRDALGVPLAEVGPLLRATGDRLHRLLTENGGKVLTGHEVIAIRRDGDGLWRARVRDMASGAEHERVARNVVIATGGHQPLDRLVAQRVAGAPLPELARHRLVQSDDVLSTGGFEKVADLIGNVRAPRIAVIGGSTSALATVALLLKKQPALPLGAGAITLLHRRPLRPFYHSVEAAAAENFTDFGPNDICPVSGFVYRLGGFRLEARDLVLRMLGVDGREPDPRVTLHRIGDDEARAREIVAGADLAIAALGYRPRALPVERFDGTPLALAADEGRAMVDRHCRVLDAGGAAVPGLYGIGLAAGFVPWGKLGGEASFVGQANGLWLWQNDVGMMIVDQLLAGRGRRAA
ncbi:DegT/DnrJ/EryC1/StrS family aminotransferase [Sphingomonas sp. 67-36]|uniref:DegT/DnrJ/EryC1/StrS family aminotransferase n=1 Tax=Sphingomonas sp. 67-36 TaxID=1895849 RepID=UPI0009287FB9|nr:DegT/DnrJ/EryC1/StrS family aminotransferase [Sphingomonas sp. 67-36]OJV33771.1 MAG: aminotransferase DegT [Sphingomonas sp. 67-36]